MKQFLTSVLFILIAGVMLAQSGRQYRPLYIVNSNTDKNSGWHVSGGITYTPSYPFSKNYTNTANPDTSFSGELSKNGRIGLYLEGGRQHIFENMRFLDYIDYGLAFKMLRGREEFTGQAMNAETNSMLYNFEQESTFSESFLSVYANFNDIWQIGDYKFIVNSLGVNADYQILQNNTVEGNALGMPMSTADALQVQLHYKFGFGFKVEDNLLIIPSIETPIMNVLPFESGASTLPYFNSRYRPFILSIRFMWMSKIPPRDCVGAPDGKRGDQLFDKKMRKRYSR